MNKLLLLLLLIASSQLALGASNRILFNGGVTIEERATAPAEGTRLVFAITAGNYLSNIAVTVTNSAGNEIINATTEGPWLILDLEPGRYQVIARRSNGQEQSLSIQVDSGNQEFAFHFPE